MLAIRPNTKDGYVYVMNGEAIEEDEDARSAGDAICRHVFLR